MHAYSGAVFSFSALALVGRVAENIASPSDSSSGANLEPSAVPALCQCIVLLPEGMDLGNTVGTFCVRPFAVKRTDACGVHIDRPAPRVTAEPVRAVGVRGLRWPRRPCGCSDHVVSRPAVRVTAEPERAVGLRWRHLIRCQRSPTSKQTFHFQFQREKKKNIGSKYVLEPAYLGDAQKNSDGILSTRGRRRRPSRTKGNERSVLVLVLMLMLMRLRSW